MSAPDDPHPPAEARMVVAEGDHVPGWVREMEQAKTAVDDLPPAELHEPRIDTAAVADALGDYLRTYEATPRPLRWCGDPAAACRVTTRAPYPAFWSNPWAQRAAPFGAAWNAGLLPWLRQRRRDLGHSGYLRAAHVGTLWQGVPARLRLLLDTRENPGGPAAERLREPEPVDRDNFVPDYFRSALVAAFAAGLFYFRIEVDEVVCVARPAIWIAGQRLHRADGPAIVWPSGERHFLWHGVAVPAWFIEEPDRLTAARIRDTRNAEVRRCMIERFGIERFAREAGAQLIAQDRHGRLWTIPFGGDLHVVVEVENGTREPDGTRRRYFLRVPPTMRSAHEAVAWTYGLTREQYEVAERT